MIEVRRYCEADRDAWNAFLENSRTPIFLFARSFMEYHRDRFTDHSLVICDDGRLVAIFPASRHGDELISHGGLTFGGFIVGKHEYARNTLRYMAELFAHCHHNGIPRVVFKQNPSFYSVVTQDETDHAMFLMDAEMYRMDTAFAIDMQCEPPVPYQERRRRAVNKALKAGVIVTESNDFSAFWETILTPNLLDRFGVAPVHSLSEIRKLHQDNPGHIRMFEARINGALYAGTVIFETPRVAHAQYISANDEGRRNGAIDLLFHVLITEVFRQKRYFDFGIANEQDGHSFNTGLMDWKEGFGARPFAHRFYRVDTSRHARILQSLGLVEDADPN